MYVPPYDALLRRLKLTRHALDAGHDITIPGALLKLLLQLAIAHSDFDEESYLSANPDVRGAVERNEIESGQLHYIGFGYFEGRSGGAAPVDEGWYLQTYPDVAAALAEQRIESASLHFREVGAGEGRSPNAEQQDFAAQWKMSLRGV